LVVVVVGNVIVLVGTDVEVVVDGLDAVSSAVAAATATPMAPPSSRRRTAISQTRPVLTRAPSP
jgi:hypothetical protein